MKKATTVQNEKLFEKSAEVKGRVPEYKKQRSPSYPCQHCNRQIGWDLEKCPFCGKSLELPF